MRVPTALGGRATLILVHSGRAVARLTGGVRRILLIALLLLFAACSDAPETVTDAPPTIGGQVTNTPRPATNTPRPPTNTPRPATNTPRPPTATRTGVATALPVIGVTPGADGLFNFVLPLGFGAERGFWDVFYTAPSGSRDPVTYVGGIDVPFVEALAGVERTLDIAAFEFNNPALTTAVLAAIRRGVTVRIVTDSEHGYEDAESTLKQVEAAGVRIVQDNRSALMHNKFMILDGLTVVTGSWNFTINDTYRNNNNALFLRSPRIAAVYQAEFNEMYLLGRFGPTGSLPTSDNRLTIDGVPVEIYFSPDDSVLERINSAIRSARRSIRFMAFSFTEDSIGDALIEKLESTSTVTVRGIFETTGSETRFSELTRLHCASLPDMEVRQDGGSFVLHHKVFIIDGRIVVTGSFNFSANATDSNDENLIVIDDPILGAQYVEEFDRRWAEARIPTGLTCPS
ncbi:MAG: DUF1669 domain-containing protein [Chloroflexi bacterium]|nr:DUF1669 domain-containing protein [Chloroflexota bacterium]